MIEALKSLLCRAAQARAEGNRADAEALYKQAAEDAKTQDAVARAEALTGVAQARRDSGDRTSAAIYYSEAITLLRNANATVPLAHSLRHAAEVRSEMKEHGVAGTQIDEAIRLYRAFDTPEPLHLANALRVAALNDERQAHAAWAEALVLYKSSDIAAAVEEASDHLERLHAAPRHNPHTSTIRILKPQNSTASDISGGQS